MSGFGLHCNKTGIAGLWLLAMAAASGSVFVPRGFWAMEETGIESCESYLEKKEIALGSTGRRQALFICPPPQGLEKQRQAEAMPSRGERPARFMQGLASWYGGDDGLQGALTASGEIFDQSAFTAAHRTLPFGTRVRVTFLKTGKSAIVRINDRGPFIARRIIDISLAAAEEIGLQPYGVGMVTIEILP